MVVDLASPNAFSSSPPPKLPVEVDKDIGDMGDFGDFYVMPDDKRLPVLLAPADPLPM